MESLRERIIKSLKDRRDRLLKGLINCLPLPFERFRQNLPGVEQGTYYLISGSTKSAKTQLTNFIFIFNTVLYYYKNPDKIHPKIFYFPLEETAEAITLRFMSYLLFYLTNGKVRISPTNLKSTDERFPIPQDILDIMETQDFKDIMQIYENVITFYDDRNATGVFKIASNYAKTHGKIYTRTIKVKEIDAFGKQQEVSREIFDHYIPDDPDEYVIIIVDHVSLLSAERNLDLRESINKLSEYMVILRNRYNYIPVVVQQQSTETQSLDAFKAKKIRPTVTGLADSKYTARDCTVMLGITNPYVHELGEYLKYNINKLKGNIRFVEVVINRNGTANSICPLFFDGAINYFKEMPLPDNYKELDKIYEYINSKLKTNTALLAINTSKLIKKSTLLNTIINKLKTLKQ